MRRYIVRIAAATVLALAALLAVAVVRTLSTGDRPEPVVLPVPALNIDVAAAASRLAEALRFETVSQDGQPEAAHAALEAMREWLARSYPGFHAVATRTIVGGGTLVYEWKGTDESLRPMVLMAHQDVVPAGPVQSWRHAPFSGAVVDSGIWGRGSIDNKGSLVAIMEAVEAAAAGALAPRRTLLLVFGHDEEIGGAGARAAAQLLVARGIEAEFVLDEGSLVVADHPVTHGPVALIGVSEKGFATVRVTARASGGHASAPPGNTAVGVLARAIEAIVSRPFPLRYDGATRSMLEALAVDAPVMTRVAIANDWLLGPLLKKNLAASPQGAAMLRTTIAPTMLSGAPKQNVLPAEAVAIFNLRIAPGDTVSGVLEHLRESVQALPVAVELEGESQEPSAVAGVDTAGFALIAGAARAVFDVPVAPAPVIAATDSRHMAPVSRNIYRFQPLRLSLQQIDMIHGTDERLAVDALEKMIRFYSALIAAGG